MRGRRILGVWFMLFTHAPNYNQGHMAELGACTNMMIIISHNNIKSPQLCSKDAIHIAATSSA